MTANPVDPAPAPEFSRTIDVEKLADAGSHFKIEANQDERAALARRFDILGVDALKAEVSLRVGAKGTVRLEGHLEAAVRQACIVTLVEVPAGIDERFVRVYAPAATRDEAEVTVDLDAEDPPDSLVNGIVDMGEAVAEQLALALDPYPRAPGAVFDASQVGDPAQPRPFAALAAFKPRR